MPHQIERVFAPKLISTLREGYGLAALRRDAIAGLTVAIVALPLSMALAIASGASPERGLYAAIVGGFLVSALGGSRFQVGGPAGAFIVLIAAIIAKHGFDGFLLATMMAGMMMIAMGALRLGTLVKFVPQPVIVGFTSGIAVIILASQLKDLFGLALAGPEPLALLPKLTALFKATPSVNFAAFGLALAAVALILGLKRWRPHWPGFLIAVITAAVVATWTGLPVETIGSRFGAIPSTLPAPGFPEISLARIEAVFPDALTIALLGAIESLLSAVVADGMSGRRHRSNTELVAQGIGNIGSALFGGLCVTGTIARTATNVRANAHGPISGMLHAVYLLGFMLLLAPLMAYIPLAALSAILIIVAWNMADRHAFIALVRGERGDALVLGATFLLTIFRDLSEGILIGIVLGAILFAVRMARLAEVSTHEKVFDETEIEASATTPSSRDIMTYRISGPLFFGSTPLFGDLLNRIGLRPRVIILDLAAVPFIDASGMHAIETFTQTAQGIGARVFLAGADQAIIAELRRGGIDEPLVAFADSLAEAEREALQFLAKN